MSLHTIEGTWEEIKRHESQLVGHHLRVTIDPKPTARKSSEPAKVTSPAKVLRARGAFKGMFGGTAAVLAAKQAEIDLEERNF